MSRYRHEIFGVGKGIREYISESGSAVLEIAFADCVRVILQSALSPVAEDAAVAVRRAGIASRRVKSTIATGKRGRPRKGFESA